MGRASNRKQRNRKKEHMTIWSEFITALGRANRHLAPNIHLSKPCVTHELFCCDLSVSRATFYCRKCPNALINDMPISFHEYIKLRESYNNYKGNLKKARTLRKVKIIPKDIHVHAIAFWKLTTT